MHSLLRAAGHHLITPTYTGLGERVHLANPAIDLDTHIQDIVNVLEYEDLRDIVLIGHSYGGMVATGVADRAGERIRQLIYLDAFVPENGKSLFDYQPPDVLAHMRNLIVTEGRGWQLPPIGIPPDTSPEDVAWITPRRKSQPAKTFETPIQLTNPPVRDRTYIYCKRCRPDDVFRQFLERAKREGWRNFEIDASHNPHITVPQELAALLDKIVAAPAAKVA
jgi:pimeloyl-ACP methyl ester carboxylesterase